MNLKKKDKVVVFAAHPDDEVLGCGGTIAKLRNSGVEVYIFFFAEGISSRYPIEKVNSPIVKKKIKERNFNSLNALKVLKINNKNIHFENLECCKLDTYSLLELTKKAENFIKKIKPKIIITHSPHDINNDHKIVNKAVLSATRPLTESSINLILFFEVLSSSEWNTYETFKPNLFVNINNHIKTKIKSLERYKKEVRKAPHPRSNDGVLGLATFRGLQSGFRYAEGFYVFRQIQK